MDGIGLALFIPLLKLVAKTNPKEVSDTDFITEFVVDTLNIEGTLLNILILIFFFFFLKGIMKFLEGYIRVLYQNYFMRKIRVSNMDLLNTFDFKKFSKADVGRIQNTFTEEVGRVNTAFRFYFKTFQYGILVLVYLTMAFTADIKFALIVAVGGILTNLIFKIFYKKTKQLSKILTSQTSFFQGLLIQKVKLFKYLKTTGLNNVYSSRLKTNIYNIERTQKKLGKLESLSDAIREPIVIFVVLVAIYLQVYFFNRDLGLIFLSLLLLYRALTYFMAMQEQWNRFLGASGSLDNMHKFTKELIKGQELNGNHCYKNFKENLKLKNLYFKYGDTVILRNLNLQIEKNTTLAIIGESGAGKSTLMNIFSGLLLPTEGSYFLDNQSIFDIDLNSLKKHIGYISQDAPIFDDSIFNNVTFWGDKTSENVRKFENALKKAAIYEFVLQLPSKEDTLLGNNGMNLSGGQKQRLSIARELYKDVEILLMDEATSALDRETEAVVQRNIENLKGNYTIIVIAHRLATVKNSDRIMILNKGQIEAIGSYTELLSTSSHFREMVELQNL
jgi:subfamily B ATP-binding cassette protein MsbA